MCSVRVVTISSWGQEQSLPLVSSQSISLAISSSPRSPRILGISNVELLVRVTLYAIPQLQHLPSSILPVQTLVVPDKLVRKCILNMPLLAEEGHTRIGSGPGRVENHDGTRFRLPGAFGPVWR